MRKRVTIADVAELANVHKATVSRALNAATEHQVNAATARRVQRAAKQLGYVPNIMARGLRTSLSMTIGVIVPDLTNPIFPPILRGIESYLFPRSYTALTVNTDGSDEFERIAFDSLVERRVDGFILATGQTEHPLLAEAFAREIRVVMVNRGTVSVPYPLVTGDDAAGIKAAFDHLYRLGHRRILLLAGPPNFTTTTVRSGAFTAAARAHPDVEHSVMFAGALSIAAGFESMETVIATQAPRPTAVIAGSDLLAVGMLRSLRKHGLSCPRDLSIVGFNDIPFAADFSPPLTTVHASLTDMGAEAAKLLLEGIAARSQSPVTVTLPVSLVVRESTATPFAN